MTIKNGDANGETAQATLGGRGLDLTLESSQ